MGPADVEAALSRARSAGEALRRRSRAEIVEPIGALLERCRDPASSARARLEAELPDATGFSPEVVRAGLTAALTPWTPESLHALVESELADDEAWGHEVTALVLAGALPTPTLLQMIAPLLLGSPIVVKPAKHDPITPAVIADTLREIDADLARCVQLVRFPGSDPDCARALGAAPCVVATGCDETIAAWSRHVRPPTTLVASGHRTSVAVLGPDAQSGELLEHAARALALDVALWDQLGCLSPVACLVLGVEAIPDTVVDAFARAFAERAHELPRGRLAPGARAAWAHDADAAELRAAADPSIRLRRGDDFALVFEADAVLRPTPLHRFLRVHPVADLPALEAALAPLAGHLAGIGAAGLGAVVAGMEDAARRAGASRLCELGVLQAPPLDWQREGRQVLSPLLRSHRAPTT